MMIRQRGLTMVELLIGLAISSFIIVGTVFVYSQSRTTYTINDTQARLQEYGRYAIGVLEPDLQLAGYYGFSNNPSDLRYYAAGSEYPVSQLEQADTAVVTTPEAIHSCGNNFVIDLLATVQGTNNKYVTNKTECDATGGYVDKTDTLTIRRASTAKLTTADATHIQLYINVLKRSNQYIFNADKAPDDTDNFREIRDLIVRKYYVSPASDGRDNLPSLRRKYLAPGPKIADEEIMSGVEDMQIQFGIDTGDHNAVAGIDQDDDKNGIPDNPNGVVSRWVDPDSALLLAPTAGGVKAQVVAVRLWLRIRAEDPETAYIDNRKYEYAGVTYTPSGTDATYRRILVTRTVYLRNARTL